MIDIVVTGFGIEVPGVPSIDALATSTREAVRPEFEAHKKLGRKGLLYKDRATRLALCAAQTALADASLPVLAADALEPDAIGIVVSSNLGNLDTTCKVLEAMRAKSVRDASPLDLPNVSSNVIASSLALRFGCRAVNLMVCSGASGGVDALHFAANAIRAKRARRMLVVGVEPENAVTARLMSESLAAWLGGREAVRLVDGAAVIVLEDRAAARERGVEARARIAGYGATAGDDVLASVRAAIGEAMPRVWFTPPRAYSPTEKAVSRTLSAWSASPEDVRDLTSTLGECYGALGVFQAIAACATLRNGGGRALVTSGASWNDGTSSLAMEAAS